MTTQPTLFDRRARLRRLLDEADAATESRRRLAREVADAGDVAAARAAYVLLVSALVLEEEAEAALDGVTPPPAGPPADLTADHAAGLAAAQAVPSAGLTQAHAAGEGPAEARKATPADVADLMPALSQGPNPEPTAPPAPTLRPPAAPADGPPACPPSSRDLGVVEVAPGARGRLVMDAAGRYRLLVWDREGAFGTWHDPGRVDGYSPTREEIGAACTAAAGVRLWEPDWYPCVEAPAGRAEFSLRFDPAEHPERWRFVSLVHLGKRWSAVDEHAETLGELAAMLEGGRKLTSIKGVREKDAPELAAALVDLWVKETEEGGRGFLPGWLSLLASRYPPPPAAPEEPAEEAPADALTTGEVAKLCQVAPRTVSKWFDSGKLKGYRVPGTGDRRIPRDQLARFLKDNGMAVPVEVGGPAPEPRRGLGPDNRCVVEVPGGGVLHVLWDEPRGVLEAEARRDFGDWHDHTAAEMTPDERAVAAAISAALGWPVEVESYTVTTRGLPRFGLRRAPRGQQAGLFGEGGAP